MQEPLQLGIAISDAVLAAATLLSGVWLLVGHLRERGRIQAAACLVFIGITAAVGAARYWGADVVLLHASMSWTSRAVVLPLFSVTFAAQAMGRSLPRPVWYALGIALGALGWAIGAWAPALGLVPPSLGMALILFGASRNMRADPLLFGIAALGVAIEVVGGLVIGTQGEWGGVARVSLFHYALAVAHPLLAMAFARIPPE